ncbi:MAG: hypothetical protein HYX33_02555 [Actinobacteria bacterium]|nr:hypothetical protein [Actinomycetota bacterium]
MRFLPGAVALAAVSVVVPIAAAATTVVYARVPAATVLQPALPGALLQGPNVVNARWPLARQVAKVRGRELALLGSSEMLAALREAIDRPGYSGFAGIDELAGDIWTLERTAALDAAIQALGPNARRIIVYVAPALVGAVGRADPRRPLEPRFEALVAVMRRAGITFLETYRGDLTPLTPAEAATNPTRWIARWGGGDPGRLRLLMGPAVGTSQSEVWRRFRSTPAGRTLLANGPGAYGIRDVREADDWIAEYRAFLAAPTASPAGGDATVPVGGGLTIALGSPGSLVVTLTRPARAALQLIPAGAATGRVIATFQGPIAPTTVRVPADTRPGTYRAFVVAMGDGLRDEASVTVRVAATVRIAGTELPARLPVSTSRIGIRRGAGRRMVVRIAGRGRATVLVVSQNARGPRNVTTVTGPTRATAVSLPGDLARGRHTAVAVLRDGGLTERVALPFTVGPRWGAG